MSNNLEVDIYTIYVVNQSSSKETFWCFLAKPEQLQVDPDVFANSSSRVTLKPDSGTTTAKFDIPVQYKLAAKSINKAVGLDVRVSTENRKDVNLEQEWLATFYTGADHQAPDLEQTSGSAKEGEIKYLDNSFNPNDAIKNSWYPSQSFGMSTAAGFIGMTWEARPKKAVAISPNITFYINTGDFSANELANYTTVSRDAAILTKNSFSGNSATVTYLVDGNWKITPGRPPKVVAGLDVKLYLG